MLQVLIIILSLAHAFHLSKTEVNYDTKSNSIQIASKVFIDDLESELKYEGFSHLNIGTSKEKSNVDSILHVYFIKKLCFSSNGKTLSQEFVGKEMSDDLLAVWVYIEVPIKKALGEVKINNTILTKMFDDQQNMVIIKRDNKMIQHEMLNAKNIEIKTSF